MDLCSVCSHLDLRFDDVSEQILGLYDDILKRSQSFGTNHDGCGGCAFFCEVLQTSNRWHSCIPELSGHTVFLSSMRLDVKAPHKFDTRRYTTDDLLFDICTEEEVSDPHPEIDCKRPVPVDPLDSNCFDLINHWTSQCKKHTSCSIPAQVTLPKRVIEIPVDPSVSPKLRITNGELGQYVILSHCWGNKGLSKLTDSVIAQYQEAIDIDLLPQSFKDAILITRRLGFRYLWVDALCIIQGNVVDWENEAAKMAYYYGSSTLMISATVAKDSSEGILTNRHVPYSPVLGKEKRYCLRQRLLRWDRDIKESALATRGWTAQERMLAPRILHYTRRQIIWECAEGLRFEASGISEKIVGSGQVDWHFHKSNLQPSVTKALNEMNDALITVRTLRPKLIPKSDTDSKWPTFYDDSEPSPPTELTTTSLHQLRTWQQCVDEYSSRSLTIPTDKLHALAGVADILNHDAVLGSYLAGLWSLHLAASLDWARPYALLSSPPVYTAPSWSWASVVGAVSSLVLASSPEILLPPTDEMGKTWAKEFEVRLVAHHIVWQNVLTPYGAVLEGSYIIVEGACITHEGFVQLSADVFGDSFRGPTIALDKSDMYDCPCCGPGRKEEDDDEDGNAEAQQQNTSLKPALPFDFCMFLVADAWRNPRGFVDMLLLSWVDEEAKVAERVGIVRMSIYQREEDLSHFDARFRAAAWERWILKLV